MKLRKPIAGCYHRPMKSLKNLIVVAILMVAITGCTSSGTSSDSWSRSYLLPSDRVIDAVVDVLEDENYLVDIDRKAGRITAEPSRSRTQGGPILTVRVDQKKDGRVRVDVQTRSGTQGATTGSNRDQTAVLEFLHELDQRLRTPTD